MPVAVCSVYCIAVNTETVRNEDRKKRKTNNDVASTRCRLIPLQVRVDKLARSHKQFALRLLKYVEICCN